MYTNVHYLEKQKETLEINILYPVKDSLACSISVAGSGGALVAGPQALTLPPVHCALTPNSLQLHLCQ